MTDEMKALVDRLEKTQNLEDSELKAMLLCDDPDFNSYLNERARAVRELHYGKDVYLRGLVEFTNYCKNNCLYCGIRAGNRNAERYRLSEEEILECADEGYKLGFRTLVLQGGEDPCYDDEMMVRIVRSIKERHPDCAVTLSIGERSKESYKRLHDAGADRYLLRHETACEEHYSKLHPKEMSFDNRMECLRNLRRIGYQVGCGMMIGSPYQTVDDLVKDLRFIKEFEPEMVGMGPFIPHHDTPFKDEKTGSTELTVRILSIVRLLLPTVLLPATTALGTVDPMGREKGILAGANVLMPNLSPSGVRKKYLLYDNKICTGEEAAECIKCLARRVERTGYRVVESRGDHVDFVK